MIAQIRVDDRLIHGQVALVWTKELNTNRIIVANKHAVESDALRMTLQMGTPAGQEALGERCSRCLSHRERSPRRFYAHLCAHELREGCARVREGMPGQD